jgi:hypothetical protein
LAATPKNQGSNGGLLSLYFLLSVCVAAIAWLVWRTKQIQSEIIHASWSRIVPEHEPLEEHERRHAEAVEDALHGHDEPFLDHKDVIASGQSPSTSAADTLPAAPPAGQPLQKDAAPAVSEELRENDYKFYTNARSSLPNAEEILDEIQQAEFWMDMQQPQRAIDILESTSNVERPSSPLPWLYLFDLYRLVGSKEKYEELTGRFEHIFNGKVAPWGDGGVLEHTRSLEDFPILIKKIIQLWGTDELIPFMENLLIDDRDGRRQGFDLDAYRDILFLTNIAYEIQASKSVVDPPPKAIFF